MIARAQQGDSDAIARLYHLYEQRLAGEVYDKLGGALKSQMESRDLTQSVWKDVISDINQFEYRGPESFYRWLVQLSIHKIQTKGRYFAAGKRDLKKVKPIQQDDFSTDGERAPASTDPSPSEAAISRESLEKFKSLLDQFNEEQRRILIHRMRDGLDYGKIAEIMGKSTDATKKMYSRSLQKLVDLYLASKNDTEMKK